MKKILIICICFFLFACEKENQNINQAEKVVKISEDHKENSKNCINKLDTNFFEENKNKWNKATLQAFQLNTNCYYILIEKNTLPLYIVFSFDDTSGTKNLQNGAYYFFDSINIQDFDGHDYIPIQWDFINSLDNLLIENNLSIPKISYNLEDDLKNGYFISNSIEEANYENILEKIWEYRNSKNYFEQKTFFKNEDRKFLDDIKSELQNLKECWINCEKRYKKIYEQYIKAQKIFWE